MICPVADLIYLPTPTLKMVAVELTNICNLKCKVCWSQNPKLHPPRPRGYMTTQTFTKIMDELAGFNDLTVALSYSGESMLHPRFTELSRKASKQGFKHLQLATNGTCLNNKTIKVLAECYTQLAVSLHNTPLLPKIIRNTKRLHLAVEKSPSCVMRVNIVAEEFAPVEIDKLVQMMYGHCNGMKVFNMITEDMHDLSGRRKFEFCPPMFSYLGITWDGETVPCCHILSPGTFTLGNVVESSVERVFNGTQYRNLRYGKVEGTPCEKCDVYMRK